MYGPSTAYTLTVRQQPERAKVVPIKEGKDGERVKEIKEKGRSSYHGTRRALISTADAPPDRKPIDPPPIVQLQISDPTDPAQ